MVIRAFPINLLEGEEKYPGKTSLNGHFVKLPDASRLN